MKSKAQLAHPPGSSKLEVSNLVYIYSGKNKSKARDPYLVTKVEGIFCNMRKFISSQLRSTSYCVRNSECCQVPGELSGKTTCEWKTTPLQTKKARSNWNPFCPLHQISCISHPADQDISGPGESDLALGSRISNAEDSQPAKPGVMLPVST